MPQTELDATPQAETLVRTISAKELLQEQACIHIEHAGAIYSLRITRNGKLILTK